jgi:hypothetical protein
MPSRHAHALQAAGRSTATVARGRGRGTRARAGRTDQGEQCR